MLPHLLEVGVGDQERNVEVLSTTHECVRNMFAMGACVCASVTDLCWLSSHDDELFRALHQEAGELVAENRFNLVLLLDLNGHSNAVHGRLDEALFHVCTRDCHGVQQQLLACADLHLNKSTDISVNCKKKDVTITTQVIKVDS